MTALPPPSPKKMGLVIDLDTCVGCHACATSCKEWNAGGIAGPLTDENAYGKDPSGVWFNRVHSYEVAADAASQQPAMTLHFPRSCLHCEAPACVTVCPTGASYKRAEDGIVLVDEDKCIGCKLCSWACPYGAREYSHVEGVMKKCTLCIDRIYNEKLEEAERQPAEIQRALLRRAVRAEHAVHRDVHVHERHAEQRRRRIKNFDPLHEKRQRGASRERDEGNHERTARPRAVDEPSRAHREQHRQQRDEPGTGCQRAIYIMTQRMP